MKNLPKILKLCLVTNWSNHSTHKYQNFISEAVRGGVTMVQLREKGDDIIETRKRALALQETLKGTGVPLIINDNVHLAAEIDADGVHIGQQDMNVDLARKILGPKKIIGLSIESFSELEQSNTLNNINYVTASAVFPSKTKPECKKIWGLAGLQLLSKHSRHPITAIGGIKHHNAFDIMRTGTHGIAVIGAIHDAKDPYESSLKLKEIIDFPINKHCFKRH
jgi:thiamine-phosphate pyrophosphorylase